MFLMSILPFSLPGGNQVDGLPPAAIKNPNARSKRSADMFAEMKN